AVRNVRSTPSALARPLMVGDARVRRRLRLHGPRRRRRPLAGLDRGAVRVGPLLRHVLPLHLVRRGGARVGACGEPQRATAEDAHRRDGGRDETDEALALVVVHLFSPLLLLGIGWRDDHWRCSATPFVSGSATVHTRLTSTTVAIMTPMAGTPQLASNGAATIVGTAPPTNPARLSARPAPL